VLLLPPRLVELVHGSDSEEVLDDRLCDRLAERDDLDEPLIEIGFGLLDLLEPPLAQVARLAVSGVAFADRGPSPRSDRPSAAADRDVVAREHGVSASAGRVANPADADHVVVPSVVDGRTSLVSMTLTMVVCGLLSRSMSDPRCTIDRVLTCCGGGEGSILTPGPHRPGVCASEDGRDLVHEDRVLDRER
jgi:hypothetical protein